VERKSGGLVDYLINLMPTGEISEFQAEGRDDAWSGHCSAQSPYGRASSRRIEQ